MVMPRRALIAFAVIIAAFVCPYRRAPPPKMRSRPTSARWMRASPHGSRGCGPMPKRSASVAPMFDANTKGLKLDWSLPHLVCLIRRFKADLLAQGARRQMKPSRQPEFDPPAGYFNPTLSTRSPRPAAARCPESLRARGHPETIQRAGLDRRRHLGARDRVRQSRHAVRCALGHGDTRLHGTAPRGVPQEFSLR